MCGDGVLFFSVRNAANSAAEYMYVTFVVRSFKEASDEIAFLRHRFFAHGTSPFNGIFRIRMAMGTTKDMANAV